MSLFGIKQPKPRPQKETFVIERKEPEFERDSYEEGEDKDNWTL